MQERRFHLYSKGSGPYELVPTGWSGKVAILGGLWAFANGVFARWCLLFIPLIPLTSLANLVHPVFAYVAVAYIVGAYFIYFPLRAFAWRERVLKRKGYTLRAEIGATSAHEALRKYAESDQSSGA